MQEFGNKNIMNGIEVMVYKPYRINQGMKNTVVRRNDGSVKLFGFRSGISYKMVLAFLYYAIMLITFVTSIVNEITYFSFEEVDIILFISKYIFIGLAVFSPAIFLSDFKYVEGLPLFKKKQLSSSIIGMVIVIAFSYFMWSVDIYAMSKTYKKSRDAYEKRIQRELKEKYQSTPEVKETTEKQ